VLSAERQRLSRADGDHLTGFRVIHAAARPDPSDGAFPDMALARFWEMTIVSRASGARRRIRERGQGVCRGKRATPGTRWRSV
jgi:hypothetical protein